MFYYIIFQQVVSLNTSSRSYSSVDKPTFNSFLQEFLSVDLDKFDIKFNNFERSNYLDVSFYLPQLVWMYYYQRLMIQLVKVLGSVGAFGDPNVFVTSISAGVRDFFYEPALGMLCVGGIDTSLGMACVGGGSYTSLGMCVGGITVDTYD